MSKNPDTNTDTLKSIASAAPPDSPKKPVKSTAVVKYSAVHTPATYAQLQCNTDLNLPPSNWLSSSMESYGLQNVWSQSTGFTSFRMAHMFPDCVGEVDVVSDAENIKKLLKLPYNRGVISMMVHRIENTLLLDDFDIHKYLLRQAESDWEWLKKFFYEHIFQNLGDKEKRFFHKAYSRNSLQQRNLVSKFLYHSIVLADSNKQNEKVPQLPVETLEPCLPEPTQEEKVPDPNYNHNFARNVVWTFENIQMLIGTDMPIFGGQTHPCISLRLRDMSKPINVLTGIDYWLDNLMCNVPEVVMCYHLHGIVQKYELIKTEDLPNMDDSKFSAKLIRDVAQNILSFLKNNATKAGHTYWLFKGEDDDVVKLYDLTSLCSDISEEKGNPFTVPVAMLLYRVARNMKYSSDYRNYQGTIRMLLKNCIQLLAKEKYPQIVTSAHFMLSDLYIPSDTNPANPRLLDEKDEEDVHSECRMNHEKEQVEEEKIKAAIKSLTLANMKEQTEREQPKYKAPPISGTVEERCLFGLEHVTYGLECLRYFPIEDNADEEQKEAEEREKEKRKYEEMHPNVAKPFQAIPMPYSPLNKQDTNVTSKQSSSENQSPAHKRKNKQKKKKSEKNITKEVASKTALLCKSKTETLPTWQAPKKSDNICWSAHLKTLLYEKASLIFAVLAEKEYVDKNYGVSLRYMLKVLYCQKILEIFCGVRNDKSISYLLGRAGDCCFMIVQDWTNVEKHRKDYNTKNEMEEKIIEEVYSMEDLDMNGAELLPKELENLESTLNSSYKCYDKALLLEITDIDKNNLLRRLGNIHNELGVLYMNQAGSRYQQETQTDESSSTDVTALLTRSLTHLESGIAAFHAVRDEANLALLHSNTGRLMRLCAHIYDKQNTQERHFYNKAFASYQKALQVLGDRKTNPTIWDNVMWDLSTTLYTMASLLQDYPTGGQKNEELEREVVDTLQKALKHCDVDTPGPRQPVYQFRAATIQHRLASFYHHMYRELGSDTDNSKRRTNLQLSKLYYDKAAKLLLSLEQSTEYLTVQMERVALAERLACNGTTFNSKLKAYQNGLALILQCIPIMEILCERSYVTQVTRQKEKTKETIDDKIEEESAESKKVTQEQKSDENPLDENQVEENLVNLLKQRLQYLLLSLTKLFLKQSPVHNKKEHETLANLYKQCYLRTLQPNTMSGHAFIKYMTDLLRELDGMLKHIES